MADNDETEEVIDGFPEDESGGIIINPGNQNYSAVIETDDFDLNFALSGGILYAKTPNPDTSNTDSPYLYYIATEFNNKSDDRRYPYNAKVNGKTYKFDPFGRTSQGLYQLVTTSAKIKGPGTVPGDVHKKPEQGSGAGGRYYMPNLNFRETVASSALNAMIGHIPDPLSYPATNIALLVKKAFEFAIEFMNQAIDLRVENAEDDGDGNVTIDDSPEVAAMKNLQQTIETAFIDYEQGTGSEPEPVSKLDRLNDALYDSQTSNPFLAKLNQLDELSPIREALIDDSGSETSSVITELAGIKDNIGTNLTSINQTLGTVATNTGNTAERLNTTNSKLDTINSSVGSIDTTLNGTIMSELESIDNNTSDIHVSVSATAEIDYNSMAGAVKAGIDSSYELSDQNGSLAQIESLSRSIEQNTR